jgi:hypothetical protein
MERSLKRDGVAGPAVRVEAAAEAKGLLDELLRGGAQ